MDRVGAVCGLVFCIVMSVAVGIFLFEALEGGWTTPTVAAIPLWMPLAPVMFGFVLLCLQYVVEIIRLAEAQS